MTTLRILQLHAHHFLKTRETEHVGMYLDTVCILNTFANDWRILSADFRLTVVI